jgi:phospholipid/cholesterol/gamma-HCH transport system ATP-binding protein
VSLIELRHVRKAFGDNRIFEDVSLAIRAGEKLTLIGGSGTGKSVLLKLLIGLLAPDEGEIWFDGERIDEFNEDAFIKVRRRIGMLFQGAALFDSMSVYENVAYGLAEQGEMDEPAMRARVAEVLEWVGLPGIEDRRPAELSGGMKKRVGLARAVAPGPEVLLYDEPTTGLDPINVLRISELIIELNARLGMTSIVVTHDMPSAFLISDRIAVLLDKRIALVDTVEGVQNAEDPRIHEFVHAMTDAPRRTSGR